jgi:hypothetical protein
MNEHTCAPALFLEGLIHSQISHVFSADWHLVQLHLDTVHAAGTHFRFLSGAKRDWPPSFLRCCYQDTVLGRLDTLGQLGMGWGGGVESSLPSPAFMCFDMNVRIFIVTGCGQLLLFYLKLASKAARLSKHDMVREDCQPRL